MALLLEGQDSGAEGTSGLVCFHQGQNSTTSLRLIPWKRGRSVTWDVTVADTFATSYLPLTSLEAGSAAERAASLKNKKYEELARITTFSFCWLVRSRATGALRLLTSCMNLVTAFPQWLVVTGTNPLFCFRGCLWCFRRATLHA